MFLPLYCAKLVIKNEWNKNKLRKDKKIVNFAILDMFFSVVTDKNIFYVSCKINNTEI